MDKKEQKTLEYKRLTAQFSVVESKDDSGQGIIEAYVSIFDNVDLGGDKIIKGAFAESLAKKFPKGVWMHEWETPIAKTLEAREDEKGLYIKGQFNLETQRGKEAYSDLKFGIIDEFSIGYRVLDYEFDEAGTRILKKVKLYEWSPVLAGMNPDTELLTVKSEKEEEKKVKFIKSEREATTIYFADGTKQTHKNTFGYSKYLKAQEGIKVENPAEVKKIIRIREAVKQIDKAAGYVLRVTK